MPAVPGVAVMLVLPAVALVVGGVLVRNGLRNRRRALALDRADRPDLGNLLPGDGPVVVSGEARPTDEGTVDAHILGEEALLVDTEVRSQRPGTSGEESRRTDHESTDAVPFVLEDDTGAARVEVPEEGEVRLETETTRKVSHDAAMVTVGDVPEDVPEGVREYIRNHDTAATYTRWYREGAVRPGEEVFVLGEVADGPTGFDSPPVTVTGVDDPGLVVATDREEYLEEFRREWLGSVLVGGLLLVVGTAISALVVAAVLG